MWELGATTVHGHYSANETLRTLAQEIKELVETDLSRSITATIKIRGMGY
jgi:hypothetical protein